MNILKLQLHGYGKLEARSNHKESTYFEKYQHNYYFAKVIVMEPIYLQKFEPYF